MCRVMNRGGKRRTVLTEKAEHGHRGVLDAARALTEAGLPVYKLAAIDPEQAFPRGNGKARRARGCGGILGGGDGGGDEDAIDIVAVGRAPTDRVGR